MPASAALATRDSYRLARHPGKEAVLRDVVRPLHEHGHAVQLEIEALPVRVPLPHELDRPDADALARPNRRLAPRLASRRGNDTGSAPEPVRPPELRLRNREIDSTPLQPRHEIHLDAPAVRVVAVAPTESTRRSRGRLYLETAPRARAVFWVTLFWTMRRSAILASSQDAQTHGPPDAATSRTAAPSPTRSGTPPFS